MAHMLWNIRSSGIVQKVALFGDRDREQPEQFVEGLGRRQEQDYRRLVFIGVELSTQLSAALVEWGYDGRSVLCQHVSPSYLKPGEFHDENGDGEILLIVPETPAGVLLAIKAADARLNYKYTDAEITAFMNENYYAHNFSGQGLLLNILWSKFPQTGAPDGRWWLSGSDATTHINFLRALEDFVDIVVGACARERFDAYIANRVSG